MGRLEDDSWRVRRHASEVLGALPAAQLAAHGEAVLARLGHADARVREWAVATAAKLTLAPRRAAAVSAEGDGATADSADASAHASLAARAATALQPLLADDDRRVRERSAWLVAKLAAEGYARAD